MEPSIFLHSTVVVMTEKGSPLALALRDQQLYWVTGWSKLKLRSFTTPFSTRNDTIKEFDLPLSLETTDPVHYRVTNKLLEKIHKNL